MADTDAGDQRELSRSVGTLGAISTVVAGTLGAGLFVTLGTASETTGPSVVLVVALTGVLAMAIAVNYSYLATIFPAAGSAYTFISRSYGSRLVGFAVTWSKWLGYMAACGVLAIGFGSYVKVFVPTVDATAAGLAMLTVLFVVNLLGVRRYSVSQNVIFGLLLVALLVLVVPGTLHVDPGNYQPFFTGGLDGVAAAGVPLFYAYVGIAVAGQIGAEVEDPGRTLPLAMVGGTGVLVLLYVWTATVIYGVVADYTVLARSERPLATAAATFLPFDAIAVVAVGGLLATASSAHAVMAAASRLPYAWAWDEVFPQWFAAVNERWRTPHWSLVALYVVASGLALWSRGLDRALALAVFSYLVAYLAVSLTVGYVHHSRPELADRAAFDAGWLYLPAAIGTGGAAALLGAAAPASLAVYAPWSVLGLVVFVGFWVRGRRRGTDVSARLETLPGVDRDPDAVDGRNGP